jgi:hypothetical protein
MRRLSLLMFSFLTLLPMVAPAGAAAGKALPGAEHDPPVFLDESNTLVRLVSRGKGYGFHVYVRVSGFLSKGDLLRVDWKQGAKVLATAKCGVDFNATAKRAWGACAYDDKLLTATGPVEADLIYWDDHAEKEYLVRAFKVTVKTWKEIGKDSTLYQIVPDDLLAAAYARIGYTQAQGTELKPELVFWATTKDYDRNPVLRCTVDGKALDDFDTGFENVQSTEQIEADHVPQKGPHVLYRWEHLSITPKNLFVGDKETIGKQYTIDKVRTMIDNPGKWDCKLRAGGKTVREFLFTVNDKGFIEPDEMQAGAPPTFPGVVLIDVRIPKDNGFDTRVRPDAMRKSMGFGLPWPNSPKVKTVQAAFPPASGLPDP